MGQPQGSDRAQRVRGRIPRPRQRRCLRSARAAAEPAVTWSRRTARRGWRSSRSRCCRSPWSWRSTIASYVDMALKFFEHFIWISSAMIHIGGKGEMWDEEDGFFYDVLRTPDGRAQQLKVRSMVGLLPLCAADRHQRGGDGGAAASSSSAPAGSCNNRPHLVSNIHDPRRPGYRNRRLLSLLSEERLRRVLEPAARRERVPEPVRDPIAVPPSPRAPLRRSTSAASGSRSATCRPNRTARCSAATRTGAGPIWLPVNGLLVRALLNYYGYYGPNFTVECPTGSGRRVDPLRGRAGDHRAAGAHLHRRQPRAAPAVRGGAQVHRRSACGAITCCSTNTSTATTARASAPATRPAGPA